MCKILQLAISIQKKLQKAILQNLHTAHFVPPEQRQPGQWVLVWHAEEADQCGALRGDLWPAPAAADVDEELLPVWAWGVLHRPQEEVQLHLPKIRLAPGLRNPLKKNG